MATVLTELKGVAKAAKSLHAEIKRLRNAGEDKKTDRIENKALKLIKKLEAAAINAQSPGQGSSDDLIDVLKAEESVLKAYLNQPGGLPFAERIVTRNQLADVQFKLGAVKIGATLTWDSLLEPAEFGQYQEDLKAAAQDVRRRRKLQSVVSSVFNIGLMAIDLTTKIATLGL